MTDIGCEAARDSLAELALGTLRGEELHQVTAHVEHCKDCRHEVTSMVPVASQLLELIPGTEPPLGFERRVLAQVGQAGGPVGWVTRRKALITAVAAAAAVVFGVSGWLVGAGSPGHHRAPALLTAEFVQQGHDVGSIEAYGKPEWWTVSVHGLGHTSGMVTCEVVHRDGTVTRMGSFDLVGDSGSWSTPATPGTSGITQALLVDDRGVVLAVAHLS